MDNPFFAVDQFGEESFAATCYREWRAAWRAEPYRCRVCWGWAVAPSWDATSEVDAVTVGLCPTCSEDVAMARPD